MEDLVRVIQLAQLKVAEVAEVVSLAAAADIAIPVHLMAAVVAVQVSSTTAEFLSLPQWRVRR